MGDVKTIVFNCETRAVAAGVIVNDDIGLRTHGRVDGPKLYVLSVVLRGAQLADPLLQQLDLLLIGADNHHRHKCARCILRRRRSKEILKDKGDKLSDETSMVLVNVTGADSRLKGAIQVKGDAGANGARANALDVFSQTLDVRPLNRSVVPLDHTSLIKGLRRPVGQGEVRPPIGHKIDDGVTALSGAVHLRLNTVKNRYAVYVRKEAILRDGVAGVESVACRGVGGGRGDR